MGESCGGCGGLVQGSERREREEGEVWEAGEISDRRAAWSRGDGAAAVWGALGVTYVHKLGNTVKVHANQNY